MHPTLLLTLFTASPLLTLTSALGINCRGSILCNQQPTNVINDLYDALTTGNSTRVPHGPISDNVLYNAGDQIACYGVGKGGICLFMQGNVPEGAMPGYVLKERIEDLNHHGCRTCGSVPLSGDNDPDEMGILTANYVDIRKCIGVCVPK
ncbi:hypothetical protein MMC24_004736 [Lignoscripta atroalba]|nr:hypothetical protein [Lignoscripta atroalba]